jgi:hypothetical protein
MQTPDVDPMAKWRDLVGGFILAFGEIELWSFRLWRDHVSSDPAPHNFKERTGRVLSALRQLGGDNQRVVEVLVQSLRLADKRNTIAHNPMQVQVWEHSKTGEVLFEHAITSTASADYIDDAELTELRAEAEELSTRLYMALGYPEPQQHAR